MQIKEIMTKDVEVIRPEATLQEAAKKMKDLDVGAIPVCDGRKLRGMITDRDITIRAIADGIDPKEQRVQDTMTPEVYYCYENQTVEEAALVMMDKQVRRVPIVDENHDLVGIVALGDVAVDHDDDEVTGATLDKISRPSKPDR
jgi:CBS domain-containing protein